MDQVQESPTSPAQGTGNQNRSCVKRTVPLISQGIKLTGLETTEAQSVPRDADPYVTDCN